MSKMLKTKAALKDMNALITGVAGFLGKALSRYLLQAGAHVSGLDTAQSPENLPEGLEYYQTDILDFDQLYGTLQQLHYKRPVVFHLAGEPNVGKSRTEPLSAWAVNVTGTAHLLEACRRAAIKQMVFPSTALVYARLTPPPYVETDSVQVSSVYSSTKLASEALIKSYSLDFDFACRIARLGNVYGPGGAPDSIVGIVLRQVKNGGPITLKTLSSIRDFIYCEDVASGLATLAVHATECSCEIFNLSSGVPTSIRRLAEMACEIGGIKPDIIETEPQPGEAIDNLVTSIQRIKEQTTWRPLWKLEDGLRKTFSEMEPKA